MIHNKGETMVQMIVKLNEHQDRIVNVIKGKYGLKNKSDAISVMIDQYEENLEPEIRPEYIQKLEKIQKEKHIPFKSIKELRKMIEG